MRIFRYLKKYWVFAILAPLFMVGEVLMDMYQPQLMSKIVDQGLASDTIDIVLNTGLLMLGLVAIGGTFGVLSGVFANKCAFNYGNDLRKDVFNHVESLSFEQVDDFSTGSLVTRVTNDITQVSNVVAMAIRMIIRTLMQFVMGSIFLLAIDIRFGYILLVTLPVLLTIIIIFIIRVSPYFKKMQERVDDVNAVVQENITGARVVKAYTAEEKEKKRFGKANDNLYEVNWTVIKRLSLISPILSVILIAGMIAIIYLGGADIASRVIDANGVITLQTGLGVGQIIAAVNYLNVLVNGFVMLALMFQMFVRGKASIDRLNAVLDTDPIVKQGKNTFADEVTKGTIEFRDVSFAYPGETDEMILNHINLKINQGERIGILGATGCGKSTLVNLIARFYDVKEGEVLVDNHNVKDYTFNALRGKVAMCLQKSELYSKTIKENICWGNKDASDEDVIEAAKIAQAHDFISGFPEGYDTKVAEKGASLSGGQKQRISIARAIVKRPEIIVFDDSTSALDLETEAKLYKAIESSLKGMTVITIAQRVASVVACDKIVVLNEGEIASIGNHKELMETSSIYQDIYNSQLKRGDDING